jgi:uncharacterized protein (TIGR02391 family)
MPAVPAFSQQQLEAIAKLLGDLLTGSDITRVLQQAEVYKDVTPDDTKWKRLLTASALQQRSDSNGNRVARVIEIAVSPVRYADQPQRFAAAQQQLNRVLAFCGMELGDDGRLRPATPVHTLTEAQRRARNLYQRLADRGVHGQVLSYCTAELLQDNYFHAVLEATKGLFERVRKRTGLQADGSALVDQAFGGEAPRVAFNALRSDSERSEQRGLMNLFKGVYGTFRNPAAHSPRTSWPMAEQDALDLLTLLSMLHRRLDQAIDVPRSDTPNELI